LLILVNSAGTVLTANDDSCGVGSQMTYTVTTCDTYTIREGCFTTTTCSGRVAIAGTNAPTLQPTALGSSPTVVPVLTTAPSFGPPTLAPTVPGQTISVCPPFTTTNTNSAQQNYAVCNFNSCGGIYTLTTCRVSGGAFSGKQLLHRSI